MATFDVDIGSATYRVDAPDENTAWRWANMTHAQAPKDQGLSGAAFGLGMTPEKQRNRDVVIQGANNAISGTTDALLNLPTNLWNAAKALYGTGAGIAGRTDLMPELTPNPNFAARLLAATGITKPENEPVTAPERLLAGAAGGAAGLAINPTSSLAGLGANVASGALSGLIGQGATEATGNPNIGAAAAIASPAAISGLAAPGNSAMAKANALRNANAVRDETLAKAREQGYVVPPSETNPSFLNNRLESLSGKAALRQEATLRNQRITNELAAQELGLPKDTAITETTLNDLRNKASAPYNEVAAIDPYAAQTLRDLRQARFEANRWSKFAARSANPNDQDLAKSWAQKATLLENHLEQIAANAGKPDLVQEMRDARQAIAKTYDVERALNLGSADVSAPTLGAALDRGQKLSGNLETIAKFQQGPGRKFTGEGTITQTPGVSGTDMYGMAGLGSIGGHAVGPPGIAAGGIVLLRGPARALLLSKMMQKPQDYSIGAMKSMLGDLPQGSKEEIALRSLLMARQLAAQGAQQ